MIERVKVIYDGVTGPTNPATNAAAGFVVEINDEFYFGGSAFYSGKDFTDVAAEYHALIAALQFLLHKGKQNSHVRMNGDAAVIVNQMNGIWEVKPEHASWNIQARNLSMKFRDIGFNLLTRKQTKPARDLAEKEFTDQGLEHSELYYARQKKAEQS